VEPVGFIDFYGPAGRRSDIRYSVPGSCFLIGELQVIATQAKTSSVVVIDSIQDLKGLGQFVRYKP
jgi:hypothetical protein|tara:strand:- start:542 stop:739 length:198 start_codon:yes stop_codon:yes gene_type:complete